VFAAWESRKVRLGGRCLGPRAEREKRAKFLEGATKGASHCNDQISFAGKCFRRCTFWKAILARGTDFPGSCSAELLSGRWFAEITLREVVRPNYSRESGSGKLLSGKWLGWIALRKVVLGNYSQESGSGDLLCWEVVRADTLRGGKARKCANARFQRNACCEQGASKRSRNATLKTTNARFGAGWQRAV
jgi:hypothetical protein